jgi:hypothetical protein
MKLSRVFVPRFIDRRRFSTNTLLTLYDGLRVKMLWMKQIKFRSDGIDINFLSMKTSKWSDIKDIIPFITILDSRFNINTIYIGCFIDSKKKIMIIQYLYNV